MTLEDIRTGCRAGILRGTTKSVVGDCPKAVSSSLKNGKKPPFGQNGRVKMKTNTSESTSRSTAIYELDGRPPITQAFPLGLQQLLAMFVGNIVPMLLVSGTAGLSTAESTLLLQCSLLGAGVATLIQAFPIKFGKVQIGSGLPVMMAAVMPAMGENGDRQQRQRSTEAGGGSQLFQMDFHMALLSLFMVGIPVQDAHFHHSTEAGKRQGQGGSSACPLTHFIRGLRRRRQAFAPCFLNVPEVPEDSPGQRPSSASGQSRQ